MFETGTASPTFEPTGDLRIVGRRAVPQRVVADQASYPTDRRRD